MSKNQPNTIIMKGASKYDCPIDLINDKLYVNLINLSLESV